MAKTRLQKEQDLQEVRELLANSPIVLITKFLGLDSTDAEIVRKKLYSENITMKVYKNNIVKIALTELKYSDEVISLFSGPLSLISADDEANAANILVSLAKEYEHFEPIAAINNKKELMNEDVIKQLASLPSRDQLLAAVVGTISAPLSGAVRVLNGNLSGLVNVINNIKDNKGE